MTTHAALRDAILGELRRIYSRVPGQFTRLTVGSMKMWADEHFREPAYVACHKKVRYRLVQRALTDLVRMHLIIEYQGRGLRNHVVRCYRPVE